MIPTHKELIDALETLAVQADEDCPSEYRSRHFREALNVAFELINRVRGEAA